MATLTVPSGAVTLLDWAKSIDPDGKVAKVAELLSQSNEILLDMPFIEGNLPTGHRASIRTGLPTAIWRKLYQGVPPSKSLRATVEDACGILEGRSEVDKDLADLNGNTSEFRLSEGQAFMEAMNQGMAQALFYGDSTLNPEQFNGLAQRYNTITVANSQIAKNVIGAGGSGNCTSVWLILWGAETITGIFPKGSQAGLQHQDLGEIDAFDANNGRFRAMADIYKWKCGLHVKDWRYAVRIANISMTDLLGQSGTQANTASTWLPKLMVKALARIPHRGMGRAVFYASRSVKEMLAVGALDKSQNVLSIQDAFQQYGKVEPGFVAQGGTVNVLGVPVRTVDRILETESALT
ncbi:hypothetical protein FHW84_002487 [Dyella sp. SG562]|uniref:major capsid protein n=1 Tax=Dyella sp. SG562 TaxID=2587017 RepID=UPI0014222604|nr:hypothetical protein [Dyella sp. SG562]NII73914.1 hypothetical protein [Dyella sp. SG562]